MVNKEDKAPKEHKKNWRETNAAEVDIQEFLNNTVRLRQNEITGEQEFRVPEISEYTAMGIKYPTGETPLDEWRSPDTWYMVDDRFVNSLCNLMALQKSVSEKKMWQVIRSDYVKLYNPFVRYLSHLPPWDRKTNPILDLALSVTVKGGPDENLLFYYCLRKWLVAVVAGWLDRKVVNEEILVFVGRQGIFKTTVF